MKDQRYHQDLLPSEIILKLHRDIPKSNFKEGIELIKYHAKQVERTFDKDVYEVKLNTEMGMCYWNANQYSLSIPHFEKVIDILQPKDNPGIYFLVTSLLIRGNTLLQNHEKAFIWAELAFENLNDTGSPFEKFIILKDYVTLIKESQRTFKEEYNKYLLEVINELGFPQNGNDPVEDINSMKEMNLIWNRKLMAMEINSNYSNDMDSVIKDYEQYKESCPIRFYQEYVENAITLIKNHRKQ